MATAEEALANVATDWNEVTDSWTGTCKRRRIERRSVSSRPPSSTRPRAGATWLRPSAHPRSVGSDALVTRPRYAGWLKFPPTETQRRSYGAIETVLAHWRPATIPTAVRQEPVRISFARGDPRVAMLLAMAPGVLMANLLPPSTSKAEARLPL